ncbi:MAG: DUF4190 domain-containing protein [Pyrinomonadaceae bacterium]
MKRCPTCNRIYTDQALGFCIDDGTPLVRHDTASSDPTAIFPPAPTLQMPPTRATEYMAETMPSAPPQPYGWANDTPESWSPPPPPTFSGSQPQQGLALASLILGLVSITVGWCCSFGLLTSPIAIVLGIISLFRIKNNPEQYSGKPLAIIGIATGGLYIVFWILLLLIYGISFLAGGLN